MSTHVTKYETGKTAMIISGIVVFLGLATAVAGGIMDMGLVEAGGLVVAVLVGVGFVFKLDGYRDILLYEDKLEVKSVFRGVVSTIPYSDIKQIGFQKSKLAGIKSYDGIDPNSVKSDDLIILCYTADDEELDGSDYDHLHEVYDFLEARIKKAE